MSLAARASGVLLTLSSIACGDTAAPPPPEVVLAPLVTPLAEGGDLNGDGQPDTLDWTYTGGAHCCYVPTLTLSGCNGPPLALPLLLDGGGVQRSWVEDFDGSGVTRLLVETDTYNGERGDLSEELRALGIQGHDVVVRAEGCAVTLEGIPPNVRGALDVLRHPVRPVAAVPFQDAASGRYGYRGADGSIAIPPALEAAGPVEEGVAVVRTDEGSLLIRSDGAIVATLPGAAMQDAFTDGRLLVWVVAEERWGYVGRDGQWAIAPELADARPFSEGLAAASPDGERWGYLSADGAWVVQPRLRSAASFAQGEAVGMDADGLVLLRQRAGRVEQEAVVP